MLKKITHILFALLILLVSGGMTISKHYCGTSLKSISINATPDNCCETPSDCCHNESFTLKIENDFSFTTTTFDFNTLAISLPTVTELIQISEVLETKSFPIISREGPPPKIQRVLSKLQVYLF